MLAPEPFLTSVVLAGGLVAAVGTDEQRAEVLGALAAGESVLAFAHAEPAEAGAEIALGGRVAGIVSTPGHSAGHVAAWIPDAGLLAAGDAVMGDGIPTREGTLLIPPMYSPPAAYRATIERILSLPLRILATGHEPILAGEEAGAFLDASRAACDRMAGLVGDALDDVPRTLLALCTRVHAAYGGLPGDRVADLALTVDGHLAELVAARRAGVTTGNPRRFRSLA